MIDHYLRAGWARQWLLWVKFIWGKLHNDIQRYIGIFNFQWFSAHTHLPSWLLISYYITVSESGCTMKPCITKTWWKLSVSSSIPLNSCPLSWVFGYNTGMWPPHVYDYQHEPLFQWSSYTTPVSERLEGPIFSSLYLFCVPINNIVFVIDASCYSISLLGWSSTAVPQTKVVFSCWLEPHEWRSICSAKRLVLQIRRVLSSQNLMCTNHAA